MAEQKKIYISGMGCAGSTLCYNLIREALEQDNKTIVTYIGNRKLYQTQNTNNFEYVLKKAHDSVRRADEFLINVRRDIRDVVASYYRKHPERRKDGVAQAIQQTLAFYNNSYHQQNYEWIYEKYKQEPIKILSEMLDAVHINYKTINLLEVVDTCENIKNTNIPDNHITKEENENKLFQKTFMVKKQNTNNGVIGSYKDTLTEQEIKDIENHYGEWLINKGYTLCY